MNKVHQYQGITGLKNIAKHVGMNPSTLATRVIEHKWSIEKAVNTPVKKAGSRTAKKVDAISVKTVFGVRFPDELSPLWRLSLGMKFKQKKVEAE